MRWGPYVSVATRRAKAASTIKKLGKKGKTFSPIETTGRTIAKTFWGKAWCEHIEAFSHHDARLARGRTLVRNGSVYHLGLSKGSIEAMVMGSGMYNIKGTVTALQPQHWQAIKSQCTGSISSMLELLQGKISDNIMAAVTNPTTGLFPAGSIEIKLSCTCPDGVAMCKHIAAVLYGVGARLDHTPELLFTLRGVDHHELISAEIAVPQDNNGQRKVVTGDLSALFGVSFGDDLDQAPAKPSVNTKSSAQIQRPASKPVKVDAFKPRATVIKRLRARLGMNKAQFARLIGVTSQTVTRWEAQKGLLKINERSLESLKQAHERSLNTDGE